MQIAKRNIVNRVPWLFIWICGIIVIIFSAILGKHVIHHHRESAAMMEQLFKMDTLLTSKNVWNSRVDWINQSIPRYDTYDGASDCLLKSLSASLSRHGLELESHKIYPRKRPESISLDEDSLVFDETTVNIKIKGDERTIVKWIHEIQTPGKFTGIENLAIELDHFGLVCDLDVTQWYLEPHRSLNAGQHLDFGTDLVKRN